MKNYFPYKANDGKHKYYIITNNNKKVYFGQDGASDMTHHKNEQRKQLYINRHSKKENWTKTGINTAGFWSRWLLWNKKSIRTSYNDILHKFSKSIITVQK
jgi:hypothetical protein